jgi:DNA-binding NtrC family response regulator
VVTILILDEEADSCMLLKRLLDRNANHLFAFVDAGEALECAATNSLDLAIVNVSSRHGPRMDVLAALKSVNPDVKVMVIADYLPRETAEGEPADCFLVKPMDIDAVEKKVRELLQHPSPNLGSGKMISCNITGSFNK